MNLYVSLTEIKNFLDIGGTSKDALLLMLNKQATSDLNEMLSVNDLALHKNTGEVRDAIGQMLDLRDLHAVEIESITDDGIAYSQTDAYDIGNYRVYLQDFLRGGPRKALISYAAGWNASGMSKITVSDVAGLAASATITLGNLTGATNGGTLTRGVAWAAKATEALEAAAIAAAINTTPYARAFAINATVYVIENGGATIDVTPQLTGRTIATSDATRLALSSATLSGVDFPESLRGALLLLVSGKLASRKAKGVKSYTIGTKTVTFATDADAAEFKATIAAFKRVKVAATKSRRDAP
jgi:hypothetical protein